MRNDFHRMERAHRKGVRYQGMKRRALKLLIGAVAIAAAWRLGGLAAELGEQGRRNRALSAAVSDAQNAVEALETDCAALGDEAWLTELFRRRGYVAPGDVVFFDGG